MKYGLFINNDLITFISSKNSGKLKFRGLLENDKVYLYFIYNKTLYPPIELNSEARFLYFPGNPDILGDTIKFIDNTNEKCKIFDKKFNRFDILNNIIQKILSENIDHLPEKNRNPDVSPFFLIVPSYLSEKLKNNLINSIQEKIKPVRIINYVIPYIYNLLIENKLPANGNVLYIEMSFSDIYFQLIKTSFEKNRYEIIIEEEDKITDTKLIFRIIQMVAEELVEAALNEYSHPEINDKLNIENEIQHLIPDAQDILMELNTVDDWTSIEVDVELSDGNGGPVLIFKDRLHEKFSEIIKNEGLKSKIDQLIKKYKPKNIVLNGENLNNRFLLDFFNSYQECGKIKHQNDYYKKICRTVFENINDIDELSLTSDETKDIIKIESIEQQIIPANVYEVEALIEAKKARKRKGVLIKILLPILIAIAAFLIYKYIPITSDKIIPEKIEFSPNAGETQLLKIQSSGKWQIKDVPDWLVFDKLRATGTDEIIVTTSEENSTVNSKVAVINIFFENNISKSVEIVQIGISKKLEATPEIIPVDIDTISTISEKVETDKWSFNDLNSFIESVRGSSETIYFDKLFNHVDTNCEVYYYINEERYSSEDITTFINKIKFGGTEKLVPNSLKYNSQGKIIEFGQE